VFGHCIFENEVRLFDKTYCKINKRNFHFIWSFKHYYFELYYFCNMVIKCCVLACTNKMCKESKISFHKFPRAEGLREKWIKFTRKHMPFDPNKSFICSSHFAPEDFQSNFKRELGFSIRSSLVEHGKWFR
jgi:hypothetical protein